MFYSWFSSKNVAICFLGSRYLLSNSRISGIFLKFPNFLDLKSYVVRYFVRQLAHWLSSDNNPVSFLCVFFCEFCKISKSTSFKEHLQKTASKKKTSSFVKIFVSHCRDFNNTCETGYIPSNNSMSEGFVVLFLKTSRDHNLSFTNQTEELQPS